MQSAWRVILCSIFLCVFGAPSAHAELIARWQFDEGTGSTTVDTIDEISGIFIKGNAGGASYPTWTTDVPDVAYSNPYALSFQGLQDGVQIGWPSGLNFVGTEPRSFSFWYKPTANGETASGNYDRIMSWTSDAFEIAGTLGNVAIHRLAFYAGSCWCDTSFNMTVGTWYNITFTYDGTNVKLYVGNDEKFSGTSAGRNQSGNMYIGVRWPEGGSVNEGINGIVDDVKVYDTALTPGQIENLTAGSDDPDVVPDSTAPNISSIATSGINSAGATLTWTTDEDASTKVLYSLNTQYASSTVETDTSTRVTSHSQALTGLLSCSTYNFKLVSRDASGNATTSSASSFTTIGCTGGASPSSATSTSVLVNAAATTTSSDGGRTMTVETPANFTNASSSVVIQIKGLSSNTVLGSIGKPSSSLSSGASIVFNVTALVDNITELDSFDIPVTVSYTYTDADINGLNENSLSMYHYANGAWSELDDCSVNTTTNTITCTTPHFSIFAIFGNSNSSGSSSSSGGGVFYACKDPRAINYDYFSAHKQELCRYAEPVAACPPYTFTRFLKKGMAGEDVHALQKLMNCLGFKLGDSGPGSPGAETNLFAQRTFDAVVKFQEKYADDVLEPGGLSRGTGFFATYSQKKAHLLTEVK